ncbi:hypothetical protein RSAG8_08369, partial [Rhizoctonia solani AG-8 WAC10335]
MLKGHSHHLSVSWEHHALASGPTTPDDGPNTLVRRSTRRVVVEYAGPEIKHLATYPQLRLLVQLPLNKRLRGNVLFWVGWYPAWGISVASRRFLFSSRTM